MGQPSSKDEMTIRHQFDRLCQMALKGEAVNYYKHMDYRRKHEVTFSELSEKELSKLFGLSTLFQTNFFRLFFRYCTGV